MQDLVLSKIESKFGHYIELHKILSSLNEESLEKASLLIIKSFTKSPDGVDTLIREVLFALESDSFKSDLLARLLGVITRINTSQAFIEFFKPNFWQLLFKHNTKSPNFHFLRQCLHNNVFRIEDIIEQIKKFRVENENVLVFTFFITFVPEIYQYDYEIYTEILMILRQHENVMKKSQKDVLYELDNYRLQNWVSLNELLNEGCSTDSIKYALKNDSIDILHSFSASSDFNPNGIAYSSPFDHHPILSYDPCYIHYAIFYKSVKCYRHLINKGADLNTKDNNGKSVFDFAIVGGSPIIFDSLCRKMLSVNYGIVSLVRFRKNQQFFTLIENGNLSQNDLYAALHASVQYCNIEVLLFLIQKGLDINHQNENGFTLLMSSVYYGQIDICNLLLIFKSINFGCIDDSGQNVFHIVAQEGELNLLKLLITSSGMNYSKSYIEKTTTFSLYMPIHYASEKGHTSIVRYLTTLSPLSVNAQDYLGYSPLSLAIHHHHVDTILALINSPHIDLALVDKTGSTYLHLVIKENHPVLFENVIWHLTHLINQQDQLGRTSLHIAVQMNQIPVISTLLSLGNINIGITDSQGKIAQDYVKSSDVDSLFKSHCRKIL